MAGAASDNPELRQNWRRTWRNMLLSSIQEFADADGQRRVWLDPTNTNPHHSFGEYYCSYFDDLNLGDGGYERAIEEGLLSSEEADTVAEFHRVARAYREPGTTYDHQSILADPQWAEVVNAAKVAQAGLLSLIDDPVERRLLLER